MSEKKFFIAGVQHHQMASVIKDLSEGDELDIVPEPTNQYDPNAVRLEINGTMLGYVPKKFSAEVSAMLEADPDLECIITMLNKNAKPWEQCEVVIRHLDEELPNDEVEAEVEEEEEV